MKKTITMGNDEFILYIRKNYNCSLTNDRIGKLAWSWIQENSKGINKERDIVRGVPCLWQNSRIRKTYGVRLPRTASQMTFNRKILPKLYTFLDELGEKFHMNEPWEAMRKKEQKESAAEMLELDF